MAFNHPDDWQYIRVRGMGLIHALVCPHFNGETAGIKRREAFREMMLKHSDIGIAIDGSCALEIFDDKYRVITSKSGAGAYRIIRRGRELSMEGIVKIMEFKPIDSLLQPEGSKNDLTAIRQRNMRCNQT